MTESPQHPVDLDLRMVRYLTVVAEHRHFGRAAAALRVAQSSLSRQVRRLEQDLGARLFDRTPQGTELTEPGEVFLPRARALLRSAAQAAAAAHAAATSTRIVIGHATGIIVTPPVPKLRQRHPDADARALHLAWDEPRRALLDHRADAVICRLPSETRGLHVTILAPAVRPHQVPRTAPPGRHVTIVPQVPVSHLAVSVASPAAALPAAKRPAAS